MKKKAIHPPGRVRKIFLRIFAGGCAVFLLALLTVPFWFSLVLRPVLLKKGIHFSRYERRGYEKFALKGIVYESSGIKFQARQVEAMALLPWFFGAATRTEAAPPLVRLEDWQIEVGKNPKRPGRKSPSIYRHVDQTEKVLQQIRRWVPAGSLNNGRIILGERHFLLPAVAWSGTNISCAGIHLSGRPEQVAVHINSASKPYQAKVQLTRPPLECNLQISKHPEKIDVEAQTMVGTNKIDLLVRFGREGLLPEEATLHPTDFTFPPDLMNLKGYRALKGSLAGKWDGKAFTVELASQAAPVQEKGVPLALQLGVSGDLQEVNVARFIFQTPWAAASLSGPLRGTWDGRVLNNGSTLSLKFDLSKQPWFPLIGQGHGQVSIQPGPRWPLAKIELESSALSLWAWQVESLQAKGQVAWPEAELEELKVRYNPDTLISASAKANIPQRRVTRGTLQMRGKAKTELLPGGTVSGENLKVDLQFDGPFTNMNHRGELDISDLRMPRFASSRLKAKWDGHGDKMANSALTLSAGSSVLSCQAVLQKDNARRSVLVQQLTLERGKEKQFELPKSFEISLEPSSRGKQAKSYGLKMGPMDWVGPGRRFSFAGEASWPEEGSIDVAVESLDLAGFQDFVRLPNVFVLKGQAKANWTNGPMHFLIDFLGEVPAPDKAPIAVGVNLEGGPTGLNVNQITVNSGSEQVMNIRGRIPFLLQPAFSSHSLKLIPDQAFALEGECKPNRDFWQRVDDFTGIGLDGPDLRLAVVGPAMRPKATLDARVATVRLNLPAWRERIPQLENLDIQAAVETNQMSLQLQVLVEGESLRGRAELPLPPELWRRLNKKTLAPLWTNMTGRVAIADARIAPFVRLAPGYLRPQGLMNLDLSWSGGRNYLGHLAIDGAATLPLPHIGSIQDVRGRIEFRGQKVKVESLTGSVGGEPAAISGELDWSTQAVRTALKVRGVNLPLTRQSGMILRSDIDLVITNSPEQAPQITGNLVLRDSLFLSELKPLPVGQVSHPKTRFPFISLEQKPFAQWGLDLQVQGDRFLQIRTPFFRGEASLAARVQGTLREPVVLGDVRLNSGLIQFPFANMRVDQGLITSPVDNPYRPELLINASSRTFGYNLKLEVRGFADEPLFEFSSNPSLTSEEILMMVSAGELPRQEHNFSTRQRAGNLAFFLGKSFLSKLSASDQEEERLTLRSGENFSEQGKVTYYLEYKLDDKWSLVGEYDQFNALNAGFKWRLYSR